MNNNIPSLKGGINLTNPLGFYPEGFFRIAEGRNVFTRKIFSGKEGAGGADVVPDGSFSVGAGFRVEVEGAKFHCFDFWERGSTSRMWDIGSWKSSEEDEVEVSRLS